MKRSSFYLPSIFCVITFVLLVLPGHEFPKSKFFDIKGLDKIVHTLMFFTLTWLFCRPFKAAELPLAEKRKWFLSVAVLAVAYGVIMEFVQLYFVPFRSFELADILVDTLGSLSAYIYCRYKFAETIIKK